MRAALVAVAILAVPHAALAANKLTPKEIQSEFFDGKPFTAATTSGTKFKLTFTSDGKVTREPQDKAGAKGEGTWKLYSVDLGQYNTGAFGCTHRCVDKGHRQGRTYHVERMYANGI